MSRIDWLPLVAVAVATLVAAATDLWKFKVYNLLTVPTLALGVVVTTSLGGVEGLKTSLLGAGLGFVLLVFFYAAGGVGAGDVKLLAAVGAWFGPYLTLQVFIASALCGGVYAMALVFARGGVLAMAVELLAARGTLTNPASWRLPTATIETEVRRADRRRRLVPFAAMTCLGFFATMAWWGADLGHVWPPFHGTGAMTTASTSKSGINL